MVSSIPTTETEANLRGYKMHTDSHPLKNQTVVIADGRFKGHPFVVEEWWDKLTGGSWMFADGNPAALDYALRRAVDGLPLDDEVVYGKLGAFGKLIHVSQLPTA